jgi:hypothetical protein
MYNGVMGESAGPEEADGEGDAELQTLLNEWDPIGVYDPDTHFPSDEYDCLHDPLLARLRGGETASEITDFLRDNLVDHFGLDPNAGDPAGFAQRLVTWFDGRWRGAGRS